VPTIYRDPRNFTRQQSGKFTSKEEGEQAFANQLRESLSSSTNAAEEENAYWTPPPTSYMNLTFITG